MGEFTHFDHAGRAVMVDVSEKDITERMAVAKGRIRVSREVFDKIREGTMKRGCAWDCAHRGNHGGETYL